MKRVKLFLLGSLVIAFLSTTAVSAQRPPMGHDPMMPGPHMRDHGFDGASQYMDVTGEISVEDAITLSITITPNMDNYENMRDHGMRMEPQNFTNEIEVQITKLVEYEDIGSNGFDENDSIISEYILNSNNLEDPQLTETEDGSYYEISSNDGIFYMIIYIKTENGVGHAWKWSVELNYPFISASSDLAILQTVESGMGPIANQHMHMNYPQPPAHVRLNDTRLQDDHPEAPMFFKWDDYATIDGSNQTVIATLNEGEIALSMPQGDQIFYDPEIGVDVETIATIDSFFNQFDINDFLDTVRSPTTLGLILAAGFLMGTVVVSRMKSVRG